MQQCNRYTFVYRSSTKLGGRHAPCQLCRCTFRRLAGQTRVSNATVFQRACSLAFEVGVARVVTAPWQLLSLRRCYCLDGHVGDDNNNSNNNSNNNNNTITLIAVIIIILRIIIRIIIIIIIIIIVIIVNNDCRARPFEVLVTARIAGLLERLLSRHRSVEASARATGFSRLFLSDSTRKATGGLQPPKPCSPKAGTARSPKP